MEHAFTRHFEPMHREIAGADSDPGGWPLFAPALHLVPAAIDRLEAGGAFLELGCGEGQALNILAGAFPNSRFTGIDSDPEALDQAAAEAMLLGLGNVAFRQLDPALPAERAGYDLVHLAAPMQTRPDVALLVRAAAEALGPAGHLLLQVPASGMRSIRAGDPLEPIFRTIARFDRRLGGAAPTARRLDELRQLLEGAGCTQVRIERVPGATWIIAATS